MEDFECPKEELMHALRQSVDLQSHYAALLNQYDGGQRLTFPSAEAWVARLARLRFLENLRSPKGDIMSWSVSKKGKPSKVAADLESASLQMTGRSREEYDAAKPHLIALVMQNYNNPVVESTQPDVEVNASGSGTDTQRCCKVSIDWRMPPTPQTDPS